MPRTRSWFSSSVTSSRVWPEEMQRRSAVSTSSDDVDGDDRRDRRHDLARLLLVQVEDALEHPRLAGVERAAGLRLGDEEAQLLRALALVELGVRVDAGTARRIPFDAPLSSAMNGRISG